MSRSRRWQFRRSQTAASLGMILLVVAGCRSTTTPAPALSPDALAPSPRLLVGRIVAVDTARPFAFVELASDAPAAALADGSELLVRTPALKETGRLRVSRYVRGRTLGTMIVAGQPSPGDEVVWLAP